jgi:hypothetical protein
MGIHAYAQEQRLIDVGFDDTAARSAMLSTSSPRSNATTYRCSWVLPLVDRKQPAGALVPCGSRPAGAIDSCFEGRDDPQIHHRVKNNLQTIAPLCGSRAGDCSHRGAPRRRVRTADPFHRDRARRLRRPATSFR